MKLQDDLAFSSRPDKIASRRCEQPAGESIVVIGGKRTCAKLSTTEPCILFVYCIPRQNGNQFATPTACVNLAGYFDPSASELALCLHHFKRSKLTLRGGVITPFHDSSSASSKFLVLLFARLGAFPVIISSPK